uniref:alcohol dehydrogenase catalytic domain-containing protein n=1 Tax=Capnocytophaga gingivalis TaxID=1017 RepID=UPI0028D00AA6
MKAIVIYKAGDAQQLQIEERPIPALKEGWTLVKVKGFGINRSEIFTRQGHSPSVIFPRILGIECVGVVEATTSPTLQKGQTVVSLMGEMGRAFDGSYAEYTLLPNAQVYPITSSISWSDLAAVPETYYTAFGSMQNLQLKPTDTVLVRAAASGVGIAFLRLVKAQYPTLRVVGSIRGNNTEKAAVLLGLGYDAIIADNDNVLATDECFDKILELVGPASIKDSFAHIKEYGIICATGLLGGKWYLEDFDPTRDLLHNAYLTTFYSGSVNAEKISALFAYIEQYHVPVAPEKVFVLEEIVAAHQYVESSAGYG